MDKEVIYTPCEECKYYAPHWCSDYCHLFNYSIGEPRGCGWGVKKEEGE